jgi:hypothetical protein
MGSELVAIAWPTGVRCDVIRTSDRAFRRSTTVGTRRRPHTGRIATSRGTTSADRVVTRPGRGGAGGRLRSRGAPCEACSFRRDVRNHRAGSNLESMCTRPKSQARHQTPRPERPGRPAAGSTTPPSTDAELEGQKAVGTGSPCPQTGRGSRARSERGFAPNWSRT